MLPAGRYYRTYDFFILLTCVPDSHTILNCLYRDWHHFVYTTNSSGNWKYLDGELVTGDYIVGSSSTNAFFNNVPDQDNLRIGNYYMNGASGDYFNGSIDNVMIFDRALTDEEVSMLYNSPDDLSYDEAGNLILDKDGYEYEYDYENRITKITKGETDIATFIYDAFGRRIWKHDISANTRTFYYYNDKWQVLCEYNENNSLEQWYAYGNYIDEVLVKGEDWDEGSDDIYFYAHDHLYSPVALVKRNGRCLRQLPGP